MGEENMKKLWSILLITLLLAWEASFGTASSGQGSWVILVSDNPADESLAKLVSNLTGFQIVVTGWGFYDPGVSAKILEMSPSRVIIIGGPDAVVEDYVMDLNTSNVTTVRWWGQDRYGTNRAVISGLSAIGIKLHSTVLAPGNDPASITEATEIAIKEKAELLYFRKVPQMAETGTLVIPSWMNVSWNGTVVEVNITDWMAKMRIEEVTGKLMFILKSVNGSLGSAEKYVSNAEELLRRANDAYNAGNYRKAYQLANKAEEDVARLTKTIEMNPSIKANFDIAIMDLYLHGIKSLTPEQQAELQKLEAELKEALKNHDYEKANRIRFIIITQLMRLYKGKLISPAPRPGELITP